MFEIFPQNLSKKDQRGDGKQFQRRERVKSGDIEPWPGRRVALHGRMQSVHPEKTGEKRFC